MTLYSQYVVAPLMDWLLSGEEVDRRRRQVVTRAAGKVLEIGFGTGLNLPHYGSAVTSLTLLDPELVMPRRVQQRMDACRARQVVRAQGSAERLPFSDATFDMVVSTFALCTIPDAAAALAEVRRVLHPRGMLLFAEHGRAAERSIARWQDRLNGLQRCCACGCNLNRPIDDLVTAAGFTIQELDRTPLPAAPRVLGSMYVGVATRESK
jgi:ubiquinone/menaquinone biosynthesis C-methylase UbiE